MKKWMGILRSFRARILISFLLLQLVLIAWIVAYISIEAKTEKLESLSNDLESVQQDFFKNNRELQAFLIRGYRNKKFHRTGSEEHIQNFLDNQIEINSSLQNLNVRFSDHDFQIQDNLKIITDQSEALTDSVESMVHLFKQRGYVDFGLEGSMRNAAHELEDRQLLAKKDILQLRRHEKDFLMRNSQTYVNGFNRLSENLLSSLKEDNQAHQLLEIYRSRFNELVAIERDLGVNTFSGTYASVQSLIDSLENDYSQATSEANFQITSLTDEFKTALWIASGVALLLALALTFYFSSSLTKDIRTLSHKVLSFKRSGFQKSKENFKPRSKEVYHLNKEFEQLSEVLELTLEQLKEDKAKAEQISKYKSLFLANMSHEIRTPLNGITGMIHAMKSTNLSEKQNEYMEVVDYSANHLLDLVNMILDYSKIDAGRMKLEHTEFDLKGDLYKLMRIFELRSQEKGLKLSLDVEGDDTQLVKGDPLRIQQVLINLVNNALKFTEAGEVLLRVEELETTDSFQKLRFVVKDTGIGISEEQVHKLFEAFEQSDSSITRQYGGTGLGLTISNSLVQLMGAELKVKSEKGKGSEFSFDLNLELGRKKAQFSKKPVDLNEDSIQSRRILVAEDNPVNQKVFQMMLDKMGANVEVANNGIEALQKFCEEDFDLIFMDLQMPEMDGLKATREIKKSEKYKSNPIPIVAVTANVFSEDRILVLEAGMDDFLAKPVKPAELRGVLSKYSTLQKLETK